MKPGVHWPRGLIPARAGKTRTCSSGNAGSAAHPRACGENIQGFIDGIKNMGSSPRVRGKLVLAHRVRRAHGLIPARAGKTGFVGTGRGIRRAHPRACGENVRGGAELRVPTGSSPRVRGKRMVKRFNVRLRRLIPARAGKTALNHLDNTNARAHPRACGENSAPANSDAWDEGSSPRVRGKPRGRQASGAQLRLIPARAGKTSSCTGGERA